MSRLHTVRLFVATAALYSNRYVC